jgi:tetratricopeptide (TPR) repeat protein
MYLNLRSQFMLEGINYRIAPGAVGPSGINTDVAFDNMVNKFKWGGIENPKVYLDEQNMRMCRTFRMMFMQLIMALLNEGNHEKALTALDHCVKVLPPEIIPMDTDGVAFADIYYQLGQPEKAARILSLIEQRTQRAIAWYNRLNPDQTESCMRDIAESCSTLLRIASSYNHNGNSKKYEEITGKLLSYSQLYYAKNNPSLCAYALKNIAEDAIDTYKSTSDTAVRSRQEKIIQETLGKMRQYCPALLNEFFDK